MHLVFSITINSIQSIVVLLLDVVENSTSPLRTHVGLIVSSFEAAESTKHAVGPRACPCFPFTKPPIAISRSVFSRTPRSHAQVWHWCKGLTQDFPCPPSSVGSASGHGWCPLEVSVGHPLATSFARLRKCHSQRFVRAYEMRVSSPPCEVSQQMWRLLDGGPGATRQCCHPRTHREMHPLDASGVQPSRQAEFLQGGLQSGLCPKAPHVRHTNQPGDPANMLSPGRSSSPLPPATGVLGGQP